MKNFIYVILVVICCLSLFSCNTNSSNSSEYYEKTDSYSLTRSKAEGLATSALYRQLKVSFLYIDAYQDCDISQVKYSIASVEGSALSGFEVCGTYSIYDKYGNFKERNNFSVEVSSDGNARVTEY